MFEYDRHQDRQLADATLNDAFAVRQRLRLPNTQR